MRWSLMKHSNHLISAKCMLITGSPQEYLRGCGVETDMHQYQESIRP
jgi:hypothetical protein